LRAQNKKHRQSNNEDSEKYFECKRAEVRKELKSTN